MERNNFCRNKIQSLTLRRAANATIISKQGSYSRCPERRGRDRGGDNVTHRTSRITNSAHITPRANQHDRYPHQQGCEWTVGLVGQSGVKTNDTPRATNAPVAPGVPLPSPLRSWFLFFSFFCSFFFLVFRFLYSAFLFALTVLWCAGLRIFSHCIRCGWHCMVSSPLAGFSICILSSGGHRFPFNLDLSRKICVV